MQRRAQREQPGRAKRLTRVLVCAAAVPVMLSPPAAPRTPAPATAADKACRRLRLEVREPVPDRAGGGVPASCPRRARCCRRRPWRTWCPKAKSGKQGVSDDVATRGSCSWSSLDNNGVKGSQFRWLNVSLLRFDSDIDPRRAATSWPGTYYAKQVAGRPVGRGREGHAGRCRSPGPATRRRRCSYDLKKKEGAFKQQTVVARVENVVVTLDYNGAGLAGREDARTPADLLKDAQKAAKEAVAAVAAANGDAERRAGSRQSASRSPARRRRPGRAGRSKPLRRPSAPNGVRLSGKS